MERRTPIKSSGEELRELARSLPIRVIDIPEFRQRRYRPTRVRQPRRYTDFNEDMQVIGRFLVERGTVDLLHPDDTQALFREMHWCGREIQKLAARARGKVTHLALREARALLSEMEAAEEELFIANRRLIVNCIKPYFWIGQVWLADFLQEASKALCNAIRKFDFTRGVPFFSYSQTAIQNRLRNYFRDRVRAGSLGIRPSRDMQLVKDVLDAWRRDYREEPSDAAIAKIVDLPVERVKRVRAYVGQWERMPQATLSLDAELDEDGVNRYEFVEDTSVVDASQSAGNAEIWAAVEQLPERSRNILRMRFIEGRTLEEVGDALKLTRARIKQIQDAALKQVQKALKDKRR